MLHTHHLTRNNFLGKGTKRNGLCHTPLGAGNLVWLDIVDIPRVHGSLHYRPFLLRQYLVGFAHCRLSEVQTNNLDYVRL